MHLVFSCVREMRRAMSPGENELDKESAGSDGGKGKISASATKIDIRSKPSIPIHSRIFRPTGKGIIFLLSLAKSLQERSC